MRLLLPLLFFAAHLATAQSAPTDRTFTSHDGRSIQATVIRATEHEVWIRRNDGATFQVPLTNFSQQDQEYVSRWRRMEVLRAPNALEFAARRFPDGRTTSDDGPVRIVRERFGYEVTFTNRTQMDLSDLTIEYRYFIRQGRPGVTGQNRPLRTQDGKERIAKIPPRGNGTFRTNTVTLESSNLRPGWYYTDGSKPRANDDLRGICVRIIQDGEVIAQFSSPPNLMDSESW